MNAPAKAGKASSPTRWTSPDGQGIVSYSVDAAGRRVVFTINGQLFLTEINEDGIGGVTREVALADPQLSVIMPRISPDGQLIAYTTGSEVRVIALGADASQDEDWAVIGIDEDECTYPSPRTAS